MSENWQDSYLERARSLIDQHGWMVQHVGVDEPDAAPFTYTVGLAQEFDHPEFLVYGLPPHIVQPILNGLGARVREGARFQDGQLLGDVLLGYPVLLAQVPAPRIRDLLSVATAIEGTGVRALQVVWPDRDGHFPTEPAELERQPVLGTLPATR